VTRLPARTDSASVSDTAATPSDEETPGGRSWPIKSIRLSSARRALAALAIYRPTYRHTAVNPNTCRYSYLNRADLVLHWFCCRSMTTAGQVLPDCRWPGPAAERLGECLDQHSAQLKSHFLSIDTLTNAPLIGNRLEAHQNPAAWIPLCLHRSCGNGTSRTSAPDPSAH